METAVRQVSKQDEINFALQELMVAIPEIRGVLVADNDGLPVAQNLSSDLDVLRASAIGATAQGLGKRTVEMLRTGSLTEVVVSGTEGQIFLYSIGVKCVLLVIAPNNINVGLIHLESRECAKKISNLIG